MINKCAEINDRILLYNACKGILRVKTAQYYTEKRAFPVVQVIGGVAGAGAGGYAGYKGGDALAKRWKLDPKSWKARGLRYGGAILGGIGGAALGAVAPTMLMPAGAAASGAGAASTAATAAGTAATAGTAAANMARVANVGSKTLKAINTASDIANGVNSFSSKVNNKLS